MNNIKKNIGFTYFTNPRYFIGKHLEEWYSAISQLGGSAVIVKGAYDRALPEDVFLNAEDHSLEPIIHFTSELPLARNFNNLAFLLDVYAKRGVKRVIFGDRPNMKSAWPISGWQYENLVDHFLDRFIPLATYAGRIGMEPALPPMQPGGDYWDTAFVELVLTGLRRRRMEEILDRLILSSYGYTFNKPLSWGKGGPERWASSLPYSTPEGHEDQMGFHHFEWVQAIAQRTIGERLPVMILDAGQTGGQYQESDRYLTNEVISKIYQSCTKPDDQLDESDETALEFGDSVQLCAFSLETLRFVVGENFSPKYLQEILSGGQDHKEKGFTNSGKEKLFTHYLLLPSHQSGVSDVVLNKVRPFIKHTHPTVGFSLEEAKLAHKVSVYPDSMLFPEEKLKELRSNGCQVEVLPESGIEIATLIQSL